MNDKIAELTALLERVQLYKWEYSNRKGHGPNIFFKNSFGQNIYLFDECCDWGEDTAKLIVAACNALPELLAGYASALARAETAEAELAAEKTAHDDTRAYWRKLSMGVAQDADTDIATLKARAAKAEAEVERQLSECDDEMDMANIALRATEARVEQLATEIEQVKAERDVLISSLAKDFDCERCALNINEFPCGHSCVEGIAKWAAQEATKREREE